MPSFESIIASPPPLPLTQAGLETAYGGHLLALLIANSYREAASYAPSQPHSLYSVLGHFLGPTQREIAPEFPTQATRTTKTFTTIDARISQGARTTGHFLLDFHVQEEAPLEYSIKPRMKYIRPEDTKTALERYKGNKLFPIYMHVFGRFHDFWDFRSAEGSYIADNMIGILKKVQTPQEHLEITEKTGAAWYKSKEKISNAPEKRYIHYAMVGYILDGGLSFMPATFQHLFMDDFEAMSTLDVALRFHTADFDMNDWVLQELNTERAADGRTFSTGRLYQNDKLVASMTQQSIVRKKSKF